MIKAILVSMTDLKVSSFHIGNILKSLFPCILNINVICRYVFIRYNMAIQYTLLLDKVICRILVIENYFEYLVYLTIANVYVCHIKECGYDLSSITLGKYQ